MIVGLDHVQVAAPVGCEEAARTFYCAWLGLEEIEKPPLLAARGSVWSRVGTRELHVGRDRRLRPRDEGAPGLRLSSAAELERSRSGSSVTASHQGRPAEPGTVRLYRLDPWGNRIELLA